MSKFYRPSKRSLKNAQHYAFIDAFLISVRATSFKDTPRIFSLISALAAAFSEEDRLYMMARASDTVRERSEADRLRDTYYSRLNSLCRLWAGSGDLQKDPAATAIQKVLRLYKLNVSAQIDEETGVMDNLIADLQQPEMTTYLETLEAIYLFNQMKEANILVKSLRMEQGIEASSKVKGALEIARNTCDKLYDELTYLIEAYALTAEEPTPYELFIREWNGTLQLYQDMLNRKSGKSSLLPTSFSHANEEEAQAEGSGSNVEGNSSGSVGGSSQEDGGDETGDISEGDGSNSNDGSDSNEIGGIG